MNPIIGIIGKEETLPSQNKIIYSYEEIIKKIITSGGIPIQINLIGNTIETKELIKKLNGIILQGGYDYTKEEIEIVKYAYNEDVPLLGICLGMQTMGVAFGGTLKKIKNHNIPNKDKIHEVIISKQSKIYEIIKKEKIIVNSRHNYALKNTNLDITGISTDNIIEIIEDKTKKFFIGVQWHPESLEDEDSKKIFAYFVNIEKKR